MTTKRRTRRASKQERQQRQLLTSKKMGTGGELANNKSLMEEHELQQRLTTVSCFRSLIHYKLWLFIFHEWNIYWQVLTVLTLAITVAHAGNPQAWTWCMTIIWHLKICIIYLYYIYTQEYINIYCIVIVRKTCFALDLHMCSISVFAWLRDSVTLVPLRQEDGDELHHAVLRHQRCYLFVSSRLKWFRAPFVVIFWILFTNQPMLTDLTVTF